MRNEVDNSGTIEAAAFGRDSTALVLKQIEQLNVYTQPAPPRGGSVWPKLLFVPLCDRETELAAGRAVLLGAAPSLALHGLPGVGKTVFALALARDDAVQARFPAGTLWAALVRKRTGRGKFTNNIDQVLSAWAAAVGVADHGRVADGGGKASRNRLADAIRDAIGDRRFLLVIDDVWDESTAQTLIKAVGPHCGFVVTTRLTGIAFELGAAAQHELAPLATGSSRQLLRNLARPFDLDQHPAAVDAIVAQMSGLPLTVTLVGRFLRSLAFADGPTVAKRVATYIRLCNAEGLRSDGDGHGRRGRSDERAGRMTGSAPGQIVRELHGHITASVRAVSPRARVALAALSRFPAKPNTFSTDAARAVATVRRGGTAVAELLHAGLVERCGGGRLVIHQVIVEYGRARLTTSARRRTARRRLFDHYFGPAAGWSSAAATADADYANVAEALRFAAEEDWDVEFVGAVNAVAPYVLSRGLYRSAKVGRFFRRAGRLAGPGLPRILSLLTLAWASEKQGRYDACEAALDASLAEARQATPDVDPGVTGQLHLARATLAFSRCQYPAAEAALAEAHGAAVSRSPPDDGLVCDVACRRVAVALSVGRPADAARWLADGEAAAARLGPADAGRQSAIRLARGLSALHDHDLDRAERSLDEGVRIAVGVGQPERVVAIRHLLAVVERRKGSPSLTRAEGLLDEAEAAAVALGHPWYATAVACERGELWLDRGDAAAAARTFADALTRCPSPSRDRRAFALFGRARAARLAGDADQAVALGRESLGHFAAIGHGATADVRFWLTAVLMDVAEGHYRDGRTGPAADAFADARDTAGTATDAARVQAAFADYGLARIALDADDGGRGVPLARAALSAFRAASHPMMADVLDLIARHERVGRPDHGRDGPDVRPSRADPDAVIRADAPLVQCAAETAPGLGRPD